MASRGSAELQVLTAKVRRAIGASVIALTCLVFIAPARIVQADEPAARDSERIRGRVVYLSDALQRRYGVKTVDEAREHVLALETDEGRLVPLVEDVRGRAFRRDERLRKAKVELLVRTYEGVPARQIIRVYELADDGKFELDYWCDICAITMFELKACDCCQGPIELRRRPVSDESR